MISDPKDMNPITYNRIKAVLAEKERTSNWLADQVGKSRTTVSRWCTNDIQPSVEMLYKIAYELDVKVEDLLIKK